jgi:hypothetical protein
MPRIIAALSIAGAMLLATVAAGHSAPYYRGSSYCPGPDPYFAYYGCTGLYAGAHGPVEGLPHSYWFHHRHRWTVYTW